MPSAATTDDTGQSDSATLEGKEAKPTASQPRGEAPPYAVILTGIILVIIFVSGLWILLPKIQPLLVWITVIVGLIGIYPVTYLAYLGFGAHAQRERLKDDFRLFGLVSEEDLDDTIENLYQNVYSWPQFWLYISLIVIGSLLMLSAYVYRADLGQLIHHQTDFVIRMMFFGYLGAYVFSVQELIRRYNTFDLQPQVYSSILVRMLIAVAIVFVVGAVIVEPNGMGQPNGSGDGTGSEFWPFAFAFIIGIFPNSGIRWLNEIVKRMQNSPSQPNVELPLRNLLGMSTWHEARLANMGIDDAQNLATVDLTKLLLTTQFDTQQVANWIDQAILYVKVSTRIDRFREARITTFYELQLVLDEVLHEPAASTRNRIGSEQDGLATNFSTVLGLTGLDELRRLADYSNFPNFTYIAQYYEGATQVSRKRAEVGIQRLTGVGVLDDRTRLEDLAETGEQKVLKAKASRLKRQIRPSSADTELLIELGITYYQLHRLDEAKRYFSKAIEREPESATAYYARSVVHIDQDKYNLAIDDCSVAINLRRTYAEAYNTRAIAYIQKGYFLQAIEDLDEALQIDDRLAVAYHNRGIVYNAQNEFQQALEQFRSAYLSGYDKPGLWLGWGIALIGIGDYKEAVKRLSKAILYGPELIKAFSNRGYAYLEMGENYWPQAKIDLTYAIENSDGSPFDYNNLGLLEARQGNLKEAISCYNKAIDMARDDEDLDEYYPAHYNLAVAHYERNELKAAWKEFHLVKELAPQDSPEFSRADLYIARLSEKLEYHQTNLEIYTELDDREKQAAELERLGDAYSELGVTNQALTSYHRALQLLQKLDNKKREQAGVEQKLGLIYLDSGQPEQAQEHLQQAIQFFDELGEKVRTQQINEALKKFQEAASKSEQPDQSPSANNFDLSS